MKTLLNIILNTKKKKVHLIYTLTTDLAHFQCQGAFNNTWWRCSVHELRAVFWKVYYKKRKMSNCNCPPLPMWYAPERSCHSVKWGVRKKRGERGSEKEWEMERNGRISYEEEADRKEKEKNRKVKGEKRGWQRSSTYRRDTSKRLGSVMWVQWWIFSNTNGSVREAKAKQERLIKMTCNFVLTYFLNSNLQI